MKEVIDLDLSVTHSSTLDEDSVLIFLHKSVPLWKGCLCFVSLHGPGLFSRISWPFSVLSCPVSVVLRLAAVSTLCFIIPLKD